MRWDALGCAMLVRAAKSALSFLGARRRRPTIKLAGYDRGDIPKQHIVC